LSSAALGSALPADQEGGPSPLIITGGIEIGVLCPVMGSPVQGR